MTPTRKKKRPLSLRQLHARHAEMQAQVTGLRQEKSNLERRVRTLAERRAEDHQQFRETLQTLRDQIARLHAERNTALNARALTTF